MAWSEENIRQGLATLAMYAGNAVIAARACKEDHGMAVQPQQLRAWRNGPHAELYDELRAGMPDMTQVVINEALETARMAAITERLAIERTHHQLETGECKDPARAARDLSHIKATNVEKYLTLTGRPTEIVQHQTPGDVLAGLLNDGIFTAAPAGADADGSAIEIPDALIALPEGSREDPA